MEAKDTRILPEEVSFDRKDMDEQAEVSFKAGYDKGFVDAADISTQQAYEAGLETGRRQGMRKVEEWGNEECPHATAHFIYYKRLCGRCWELFLKENDLEVKQ